MLRKPIAVLLTLILVLLCASALADVTDRMGRTVALPSSVTRIVALTASDCEILCALGAEDTLVGRGAYCDFPASILALPAVDSGAELNIETVLALEPQVVLMSAMSHTKEQVEALEQAGVPVVVSDASNIADVYACIRLIGQIVNRTAEAEALVGDMQSTFETIAAKADATGKTVYFEVSPLQWGLWTAGRNTFMDELASLCGLTNAFADVDGWAEISEEQVLARDPDYIVTIGMYFGEGPTPVEEIRARAGWDNLRAVAQDHLFNADSDAVSRPGPRLKDAAEALYAFLAENPDK